MLHQVSLGSSNNAAGVCWQGSSSSSFFYAAGCGGGQCTCKTHLCGAASAASGYNNSCVFTSSWVFAGSGYLQDT
jgi:hypothetical protein